MSLNAVFKSRLLRREPLLGAFIKTPHPIIIEVMGNAGFDFLILDAEHAPFDRAAIDMAMIAGRATSCPILVRVPSHDTAGILGVLDCGAAGVMAPHVGSVDEARKLVRAVRYNDGDRGIAATTRAGDYARRGLAQHLDQSDDEVSLICQIEDVAALDSHAQIAEIDGVDALFVGRADLSLSLGLRDTSSATVREACERILGAQGAATGLYCVPSESLAPWRDAGASLFVVGSEHSLISDGAKAVRARFAQFATLDTERP